MSKYVGKHPANATAVQVPRNVPADAARMLTARPMPPPMPTTCISNREDDPDGSARRDLKYDRKNTGALSKAKITASQGTYEIRPKAIDTPSRMSFQRSPVGGGNSS